MKQVLGNHSSSIIKQCLTLPLQFTWKEKWRKDISTSARGLVAITFKDLLPQATFSNKILFKQDLEELQSFSFHLVHLGMARAGYSADKAAEGGSPCPSPWTGSSEPSRHESTPVAQHCCKMHPEGSLSLFSHSWKWRSLPQSGTFLQWESPRSLLVLITMFWCTLLEGEESLFPSKQMQKWTGGVGIALVLFSLARRAPRYSCLVPCCASLV